MASNGTEEYNIAAIRQLLLAAFTPEELRRFCYDRSDFRPVVDLFGPGLGAVDMVDRVVEYCDRHVLLDQLLAEVKQINPGQYDRFEPDLLIKRLEKPQADTPAKLASEKPSVAQPQTKAIATPRSDEPAEQAPEILTITNPIHLELVRIPAGGFVMGSDRARDPDAEDDEFPPHTVHVADFYTGKYPVTNVQYREFVKATGHAAPGYWRKQRKIPKGKSNHPVKWVSWFDAFAFCDWLARETGQPFRLPTEAEWEKAARGTDGRIYPWGNDPPDERRCNLDEETLTETTAVGAYSPQGDSPYGCADMAGNVWEWCQSLYRPYPYRPDDGRESLQIDDRQSLHVEDDRVLRGLIFSDQPLPRCAARLRWSPDDGFDGFRVAMGPLP